MAAQIYADVDYSTYLYFYGLVWGTRNPRTLPPYGNLTKVRILHFKKNLSTLIIRRNF